MSMSARIALSTDLPLMSVFRRALIAEWTRLWTLRSTWWAVAAGAGLFLFVGAAAGWSHDGSEPAPIWLPAQFAVVPGQFAFLLVVLLSVTGEYSTGAIRSSLQWLPDRRILLAARTLVPVIFATACAVLASGASGLVAWAFVGEAAEVIPRDIAASMGRIALVIAFGGLLTVGLGLLLRSTAATLTAVFLLFLALPITLGNTGIPLLVTISDHLPGRAIVSIVVLDELEETGVTGSRIAAVMIGWTLAAVVAGGWSLVRRDST